MFGGNTMKNIKTLIISVDLIGCFSVSIFGLGVYDLSLNNEVENVSLDILNDLPKGANKSSFEYLIENNALLVRKDGIDIDGKVSREDFVAMLFRLMTGYKFGEVSESPYYNDVSPVHWYAGYVEWARYNGVARGYGNEYWGIGHNLTKEQMCKMLYGYYSFNNKVEEKGLLEDYKDSNIVSEWAKESVIWCLNNDLISVKDGYLNPKDEMTLNDVVLVLEKFDLLRKGETR